MSTELDQLKAANQVLKDCLANTVKVTTEQIVATDAKIAALAIDEATAVTITTNVQALSSALYNVIPALPAA